MSRDRIIRELELLREGGQEAELIENGKQAVIYRRVPTAGGRLGLPEFTDVLVPAPPGYPASMIDLAGLPSGSPFLPRVKGGKNTQGVVNAAGIQWHLASYHPHSNGGGPPWDQRRHGFHTYLEHLITWLHHLS